MFWRIFVVKKRTHDYTRIHLKSVPFQHDSFFDCYKLWYALDGSRDVLQSVAIIENFACKETAKVFSQEPAKAKVIPIDLQERLLELLQTLDAASDLTDLYFPPSNKLKKVQGTKNKYELRVNVKYRLYFIWEDGHAQGTQFGEHL